MPNKPFDFYKLLAKFKITTTSNVEKIFFLQNMLTMVKAGFPLTKALLTLKKQTKNKEFRIIISEIKNEIEKGQPFYKALKKYPHVFSELFINLIEAGEISGNLEETIFQLLKQMKKSYALSKKIRNALMYPVIIFVFMIGLGIAMIVFVLPNLIALYEESNFELPLPTKITMAIGNFLINNGWQVGTGIFIVITIFFIIISQEKGKIIWHKTLLKLPIISGILQKINLAKMSRVLNSLIITDIPITDVFRIIARTLGNRVYRNYLLLARENLKSGKSIYSIFLTRPDLFPPVVSQMINVGEKSGNLESITEELAKFYEEEVNDTMANLTVIIEPAIMIIIGFGVAFVAVSVIYPIYALVNQI